MKKRKIEPLLLSSLKRGRVIILYGARRTGKTVLLNQIIKSLDEDKVLKLNGEDLDTLNIMSSQKIEVLGNLVDGYTYLFLDEAQNIPRIGQNLKLLVDTNPDLYVFVTGSASFDLKNKIGEPLTGRSIVYTLFPFTVNEVYKGSYNILKKLPELLVFGNYPQICLSTNPIEKRIQIENIKNGYLLKDILQLDNIKDSVFIIDLLKLLSFQIGNDVSLNELANTLQTSVKTIKRYLDILEKAFIIFKLYGFSGNLRKEIVKSPRYYFWDNGIRNSIISNFNALDNRPDTGQLWENFCISERIKLHTYAQTFTEFYFYRTYDKQEIDLIEVQGNNINAFEFKWGNKLAKSPRGFINNYPMAEFKTINRESFFNFISNI